MKKTFAGCAALFFITILIGCVGMKARARPDATEFPRTPSRAFPQIEQTGLRDALSFSVEKNSGKSGFRIFEYGSESFAARIALVRLADKSVDMQYYAMGNDLSSKLMMEALMRAAARGVRVRVLIDSFTVKDMKDALLAFDGMKNIEIRVFNPVTTINQSPISKLESMIGDLAHVNRRMHNKALIVDNQIAIMGGRNLSDEYFENDQELAFRDVDVLTAGPVTAQLSDSFDKYWNDKNSFPVRTVFEPDHDATYVARLRDDLKSTWDEELKNPKRKDELTANLQEILKGPGMKMVWAKGELAADDPSKIRKEENYKESKPLDKILDLVENAGKEFVLISAYFVPKEEGTKWLGSLEDRGIHVKILTNSLASTDVVAVHSGYAGYRKKLLEKGVELFELIPINQKKSPQRPLGRSQPPSAGLHTKAYIIDKQHVVIGSYNFDPRSTAINTEIAVIIHSPEIAAQMDRVFSHATKPDISYRLMLNEKGVLRWQGIEEGKKLRYTREPHAGFWRGLQNRIFTLLPVEDQL